MVRGVLGGVPNLGNISSLVVGIPALAISLPYRLIIAVRETGFTRHRGGPIEGPPETPRASQHYRIVRV